MRPLSAVYNKRGLMSYSLTIRPFVPVEWVLALLDLIHEDVLQPQAHTCKGRRGESSDFVVSRVDLLYIQESQGP